MKRVLSPPSSLRQRWRLGLCSSFAVLALVTGCSGGGEGAPGSTPSADASGDTADAAGTGSLAFALTVPPGLTFNQFFYTITGPNYSKAAGIDVSHSKTVSAVVGNIPVGSGYAVTLVGSSADPPASCTGSAAFAIAAGAKTSVPVNVACHLQSQAVAAVPIPGSSSVALGLVLLGLGAVVLRRRTA
jgi:hypothetical protein